MDLSNMNWGRFVLAWIAALGVLAIGDMIIHAGVLKGVYETHWVFGRPPEEMPFLPLFAKWISWSFLMVWIYTFGIHPGRSGWIQGASYGLMMGLFFWIPYALVTYTIVPIPAFFIGAWIGLGTVQMTLVGLAVGLIYQTKAQTLLKGAL